MSIDAKNYDPAAFDRPSVTVDIVIFTLRERRLSVLLVRRGQWPFEGDWAIPGGFVRMDESLEGAARRELREETGVDQAQLEQLSAFGDPGRDPRTRVITIAYTALIPSEDLALQAQTDAADARWFAVDELPQHLAFDHRTILDIAERRLRERLASSNVAAGLLPERFTLTQLQSVYEALLGRLLDKRNFRKWVAAQELVVPVDGLSQGRHRPAQLYAFAEKIETAGARFLWAERRPGETPERRASRSTP